MGKSSLLNALLNARDLARCSNFPGRTRHLFNFVLGNQMSVVDLPGYGLARVGDELQTQWRRLIHHYCQSSPAMEQLKLAICLVDAREGISKKDYVYWDQVVGPYLCKLVVLTKIDLLTPVELHEAVARAAVAVDGLNRKRLRLPAVESAESAGNKEKLVKVEQWRHLLPYVHAVSSHNKCGLMELRAHIATHCGVVGFARSGADQVEGTSESR